MKTLPVFVGSKCRWLRHLTQFEGRRFVEPFAGSAAISFALAQSALWNDIDPTLTHILSHFDELEVPEVFILQDYYAVRNRSDWWKWSFCLQKMAFGGLFRYSGKSGFNVPADKRIPEVRLRPDYDAALARWRQLAPRVTCGDWTRVPAVEYTDAVVIIDPPFKNSSTPYNNVTSYQTLWSAVNKIRDIAAAVVVFEYVDVLERIYPGEEITSRLSRLNGKYKSKPEGMIIFGS